MRCKSRAPFCAMISSRPSAAPFASKFLTRTCPSSFISAWKRFSPPIRTGRIEMRNVLPLRLTDWTIFIKPSPSTRARISSARALSNSNFSMGEIIPQHSPIIKPHHRFSHR